MDKTGTPRLCRGVTIEMDKMNEMDVVCRVDGSGGSLCSRCVCSLTGIGKESE